MASKVIEKLVVSLHAVLDRSGLNPGPWIINASSLDINISAFGKFLGSLKSETLRCPFARIKRHLLAQDNVGPSAVMDFPTLLVAERQFLLCLSWR